MPRPAGTRASQQVYIANESFVAKIGGIDKAFHEGRTRVRESDEAYQKYPHLFDLMEDVDRFQDYS